MDHFDTIMSLIGLMFLAIIGVYVWTFKVYNDTKASLGEIYKTMNGHIQQSTIHGNVEKFVPTEVCTVVHKNVDATLQEIKSDVKSLLAR